jgi:spore germination protein YaaH
MLQGTSMSGDMTNATLRAEYIDQEIAAAIAGGYDGINLDYEGHDPDKVAGYNLLVVEAADAFHSRLPGSEVSMDTPIYPQFEGRNYDYAAMAAACDYLFIMAYDGEFWNNVQCLDQTLGANCSLACASLPETEYGVQEYINTVGVPASKLYLGLPWYGLFYEYVLGVPFFTGQVDYRDLQLIMKDHPGGTLTLDDKSTTRVFKCDGFCVSGNRATEIWFDDETTLPAKYALANSYGLKGVGMWTAAKLDYVSDEGKKDAEAMWSAVYQ